MVTLILTGIGMPLNYYFFHGALKPMHIVANAAFGVKLLFIAGMIFIMMKIFFGINPRLRNLFSQFNPTSSPDPVNEKEFFGLRAKRKALCEICLKFAVVVLVASAFLGFGN
jgi:hypothetical protein